MRKLIKSKEIEKITLILYLISGLLIYLILCPLIVNSYLYLLDLKFAKLDLEAESFKEKHIQ